METSVWCLMEAVSGQAGFTVSNTIRIIVTGIHNFF